MELTCSIAPLSGNELSRTISINRNYNLGSATRDPETAKAHQEEVAVAGVAIAFDVPAPRIYPISAENGASIVSCSVLRCNRTGLKPVVST